MANKKLSVELELETAKAKRQARDLADSIETPSAPAEAASRAGGAGASVGSAADKLARSLNQTADASESLNKRTLGLIKGFTGLGMGLAMSYASSHLSQGSAVRTALEYAGAAVTGASSGAMMGSVAGPPGAIAGGIVGGVVGLAKTGLDKSDEKSAALRSFNKAEHDYKENKEFADFLRSLTKVESGMTDFSQRIREIDGELEHYRKVESGMTENIRGMIDRGEYENAGMQQEYLGVNRARQEQLLRTREAFSAMQEKASRSPDIRTSTTAVDALARIGGDFAGSDYTRELVRKSEEQVSELKKIAANTAPGAKGATSTWQ